MRSDGDTLVVINHDILTRSLPDTCVIVEDLAKLSIRLSHGALANCSSTFYPWSPNADLTSSAPARACKSQQAKGKIHGSNSTYLRPGKYLAAPLLRRQTHQRGNRRLLQSRPEHSVPNRSAIELERRNVYSVLSSTSRCSIYGAHGNTQTIYDPIRD